MSRPTSRVSRVLMSGPLPPFAEEYRLELLARGYTVRSAVNELRQVERLSRWLEDGGLEAGDLSRGQIEEFLAVQRRAGRVRSQSRPGLLCLLGVLQERGVAAGPAAARPSPTQLLLLSFERYLLAERGLAAGTVTGYLAHAGHFLDGLPAGGLAQISAAEVSQAVLRVSASAAAATTQNFISGLRAFLGFLFLQGVAEADLSQAALSVQRRQRSLPRGLASSDVQAILDSCDRRSALGRRDYAMVILLVRLGLRRGEVAALRLDDIDWRAGELVVRGKRSRSDRLPLPPDVGRAIAAYLKNGRPSCPRRELFLTGRAPLGPVAAGTVASTVRRACRRPASRRWAPIGSATPRPATWCRPACR